MANSPLVSWAPNAEDVVLWRALGHRTPGYFVDVGACHPVDDSITKLFSLEGWRGINIEPQPYLVEMLHADRPNDVNLGVGIGDEPGELELFVVEQDQQRTTFSPSLAQGYREQGRWVTTRTVPVMTLNQILAQHPLPRIDFLKIDAEGFEDKVIAGIDLQLHRPTVILAEQGTHQHYEFPATLEAAGYLPMVFDGVNRFFLAEEAADEIGDRLSYPACALDHWVPREVHRLQQHIADMERSESWRIGQAIVRPARKVRDLMSARRHRGETSTS